MLASCAYCLVGTRICTRTRSEVRCCISVCESVWHEQTAGLMERPGVCLGRTGFPVLGCGSMSSWSSMMCYISRCIYPKQHTGGIWTSWSVVTWSTPELHPTYLFLDVLGPTDCVASNPLRITVEESHVKVVKNKNNYSMFYVLSYGL